MLRVDELRAVRDQFGAANVQVRRDHLVSHLLSAIGETEREWVLYGGTGLAHTHLPDFRLSEDLDLLVVDRGTAALDLERVVPRRLRREFGAVAWTPPPAQARDNAPLLLSTEDGLTVRVQIGELDDERRRWPTEARDLVLRYSDVAPVHLAVPTRSAFVAMKTATWEDRHAARDLADLAALASLGAIDIEALDVLRVATGRAVHAYVFNRLPPHTSRTWATQLAHQVRELPDPVECLRTVRAAFAALFAS